MSTTPQTSLRQVIAFHHVYSQTPEGVQPKYCVLMASEKHCLTLLRSRKRVNIVCFFCLVSVTVIYVHIYIKKIYMFSGCIYSCNFRIKIIHLDFTKIKEKTFIMMWCFPFQLRVYLSLYRNCLVFENTTLKEIVPFCLNVDWKSCYLHFWVLCIIV